MSDDARAKRGNDLSHDDAQALISARMDGPLDSERNRALLAHLAGCPTCAAFAAVMEGMTVGFREIPVLPPSPVVARAVRAEVRKTGVFRSFGRWLTSSRGLPLGALGAATVALAIVAASTFGPLADRVAGPQVAAPQASVGGGDVAIRYDASTATAQAEATVPPNVEVVPTAAPPTAAVVEETATPEATATGEGAIEPRPTEPMVAAEVTEEGPEPTATLEPEPTATATTEPTATPVPPTATPAPPTATPTVTETATPEPTSTGIIVVTSEADDVVEAATPTTMAGDQAGDSSPAIKPRDPNAPTIEAPAESIGGATESAADEASSDTAGSGAAIVARGDGAANDASTAGDAGTTSALVATDGTVPEPLAYADLESTGAIYDAAGTLVASPDGRFLALERANGVFVVLSADGAIIAEGYGYNAVWGDAGVVYTVDAVLAEGAGGLKAWSAETGVADYVTGGIDADFVPVFDVPAGWVNGTLWYVRYRPAGSPSLELRSLASDEPLWSADGVALVGQNVYFSGGAVYAPTDLGWLRLVPGEQALPLGGDTIAAEEVFVSPGGDQVAFVAGERVLVAPADDPGVAVEVGTLGAGGIVWTPYGLVIADGSTVILVAPGSAVTVVADGEDLSAPVWTADGLTVLGGDGEVRVIPEAELARFAGF